MKPTEPTTCEHALSEEKDGFVSKFYKFGTIWSIFMMENTIRTQAKGRFCTTWKPELK